LHNHHASVASLRLLFTFAPERRSASLRNRWSPSPEYPVSASVMCGAEAHRLSVGAVLHWAVAQSPCPIGRPHSGNPEEKTPHQGKGI